MIEYKRSKSSNYNLISQSDITKINCFTHVANLASFFMQEYPSVIIHIKCSTHLNYKKVLPNYLINVKDVLDKDLFYNIIERMLIQFCKRCGSRADLQSFALGNFLFFDLWFSRLVLQFIKFFNQISGSIINFELYAKDESELNLKLKEIPTKFKGKDDDIYVLVGAIEYYGPDVMSEETDIEHYTALRYTSSWTKYDDLFDAPIAVKSSDRFKIKLLFYAKH